MGCWGEQAGYKQIDMVNLAIEAQTRIFVTRWKQVTDDDIASGKWQLLRHTGLVHEWKPRSWSTRKPYAAPP